MMQHGGAGRYRRLDVLIETMKHLDDRFQLDFMLVSDDHRDISDFKQPASHDHSIAFVQPVKLGRVVEALSHYDVGLCAFDLHSYCAANTLLNKRFDSIQARLCVVIVHAPDMSKLVQQY